MICKRLGQMARISVRDSFLVIERELCRSVSLIHGGIGSPSGAGLFLELADRLVQGKRLVDTSQPLKTCGGTPEDTSISSLT